MRRNIGVCLDFGMRRRRAVGTAGQCPGDPHLGVAGLRATTYSPAAARQPCRTFSAAIGKTAINGEINCIDPGGYGAVTITKSVTIDCTGTYGSILANAVTAGVIVNITPSADDPHRSVRLRGLLNRHRPLPSRSERGPASTASAFFRRASVFVEDTVINDFSQQGIKVAATGKASTSRSTMSRSAIPHGSGVTLATADGQVVAALNNVRIDGTPVGVSANGLVRADLRNVTLAHNTTGLKTMNADNIINVDNMMVSFRPPARRAARAIPSASPTARSPRTRLGFPNGGAIVSMSGNSLTGNTTDGNFTNTQPKL